MIIATSGILLALSIVWGTVRWGISPMPSSKAARRAMLSLLPEATPTHIVELGSGWGQLAFAVQAARPGSRVTGYEGSFLPWVWSHGLGRWTRRNVAFEHGDFFEADLTDADVVLTYLYPEAMQKIADGQAGLTPGTTLISNTFRVPGWTPDTVLELDDLYRTRVYRYTVPTTET